MPFTYSIDEDLGLIRVDADGLLTAQFLVDCMKSYQADPAFRADLDTLFVISDDIDIQFGGAMPGTEAFEAEKNIIDETRRCAEEARGDAEYRRACAGGKKEEQAFFAMSFEIIKPEMNVRMFDTLDEALDWIVEEEAS